MPILQGGNLNRKKYALRSGGWRALPYRVMKGLFLTAGNAFLVEKEWEQFDADKSPKKPLPWLPYCLTTFLDSRLPFDAKILEFGAGWGSVFWDARQVVPVTVVERDQEWAERIGPRLWNGCSHVVASPGQYDLVIVDSHPHDRLSDLRKARASVSIGGVIVLDDTHREKERAMGESEMAAWRFIYWEGLGPWSHQKHGATLYYQKENVLGI